jgi:hypothetical protein
MSGKTQTHTMSTDRFDAVAGEWDAIPSVVQSSSALTNHLHGRVFFARFPWHERALARIRSN